MLASSPQLRRIYSLVYSELHFFSRCHATGKLFVEESRRGSCYRRYNSYQPRNDHNIRLLATKDTSPAAAKTAGGDALTADGKTSTDCNNTTAKVIKPRPLFPWRSSSYPLPRLKMPTRNNKSPKHDSDEASEQISDEEYYDSDYFTKGGPLGPGWFSPMEPWFRGALYANSMHGCLSYYPGQGDNG